MNYDAAVRNILENIGNDVRNIVVQNFRSQGRPNAWKQSHRAKKQGGKTLRDTGRLMNSITYRVLPSGRIIIGTNVVYAGTMHYGAKKGAFGKKAVTVRSHKRKTKSGSITVSSHSRVIEMPFGNIPARPFLIIPQAEMKRLQGKLKNYMRGVIKDALQQN